ncbi:MAG: FlgD immunoglobulin-like domain containing protein [Candidatus Krumholzibacteriota bacterium]
MKRIPWLISFACVLALSLTTLLVLIPPAPSPHGPPPPAPLDDTSGPGEDLMGRHHWEWLRQRDPATGEIPIDMHRREQEFAHGLPQRDPHTAMGGLGRTGDKVNGWQYRGPWNIGGRARALAIDVADPTYRTLLAGGVSGGMWRTVDDGASWTLTTGSSQLHSVSCIVQDTRTGHENVWYYGTGEGHASSPARGGGEYYGDGVFKSTDGGLSWNVLPSTATGLPQELDNPFNVVWRLVTDPTNVAQDEVYAATWGVIYRSLDGGTSWTPVLGSTTVLSRYSDLVITSQGVLYATLSSEGGVHGIFRSPDGVNWADITPALIPNYGRITMGIAPSEETWVYFLVSDPATSNNRQMWRYSYISGDGTGAGGVWSDRSATLSNMPYPYDPLMGNIWPFWSQRGYNLMVTVNPINPHSVTIGGMHLWRNLTGWISGSSTSRVGGYYYENRSHHADVHKLIYQPGSSTVAYTASDGGVHKTLDMTAPTVAWQSLNNGFNTTQFFTVALDPELAGNDVVIGGTQDNGTLWTSSPIDTSPWIEAYGGDGAHCVVLDGSATGDYLVSYYRGNMYRIKLDVAGNPTHETMIKPLTGGEYLFINPFINDPEDEKVVYLASSNGVLRNSDVTAIPWGGTDPTDLNWSQLTNQPAGDFVSALGTNAQAGHALYYGTATGSLYRVEDVLHAVAGTAPIPLHGNASFPVESYVSGIAVHPDDDRKVLVSLGNYMIPSLWYTDDGGASWTDVEGNLAGDDGPSARCAAIMPSLGPDLWLVGTTTGLYSTTPEDGVPVVWTREAPSSLGNVIVDALAVRLSDRKVVVGTHGRGIHSVIVPQPSDVPERGPAVHLAQNTPNPFNPSTRIDFSLEAAGPVRLEVFDAAGRRVRVLVAGWRAAGEHHVEWDGTDDRGRRVGSGVYPYRLQTATRTENRKMTLVQ